jgi:hypothetical protein
VRGVQWPATARTGTASAGTSLSYDRGSIVYGCVRFLLGTKTGTGVPGERLGLVGTSERVSGCGCRYLEIVNISETVGKLNCASA